eukprot:CAMPEP_0168378570 /NCGR_PEP_ID=MMETSP0228-20121227/11404_1 /TAXON_ID=133427 /ORGANISM="Protoceratium reticulatum, Strain CCCM 535 (=CCMP 1889)" /LENGTH=133 /DNA_ID=CAMNT_0008391591 /DNA_START=80 /DNA_END=477 /DNA_ORIENTATION=+
MQEPMGPSCGGAGVGVIGAGGGAGLTIGAGAGATVTIGTGGGETAGLPPEQQEEEGQQQSQQRQEDAARPQLAAIGRRNDLFRPGTGAISHEAVRGRRRRKCAIATAHVLPARARYRGPCLFAARCAHATTGS